MKKAITVHNTLHNTQTEITVDSDGRINGTAIDEAAERLCGMADCTCKGVPMNGYNVVDVEGVDYGIK